MRKLVIDDKHFWSIKLKDKEFIDKYTSEEIFKISKIFLKSILGIDIKWRFDSEKCETTIWWE